MSVQTEIVEKIKAFDTIIIHRHKHPDPDALGSQAGLATAIKAGFPDKKVYEVGGYVGDLNWITTEEEIPDETYQNALVIVTDTADTPRISNDRFNQGKYLIKIDHHPNDDAYGDLIWVDTDASSCSEMITDLIDGSKGQLVLTAEAARVLYAGIIGDTGRFLYPEVSSHTFAVAAELLSTGFDANAVSMKLSQMTLPQARLQGYAFDNLQVDDNGAAYLILSTEALKKINVPTEQASSVVSAPGHLQGVAAWVIFVEQEDHHYRVHLRSNGPIINELAKAHDGGGHPLASGAKAADTAEIKQIIQQLQEIVAAYDTTA
ncbi:phosphoesterase, dhh family protein [Lactobacillus selangorensis]|uniref:Phosphoesterase, dhh family protein n=1 Tax=Lactobacillus selangorensis TaxID=81857 RepID=A0A0R2FSA5_9LACO|nr:bifunctional oligoribonuclease/PAP phosphatase NrnA [Lactobacillus selangorensis]KRN27450.1 phosphoesterase, dhh family protein [Lactobacillus selangorensis]KRN31353.1 phosphoesterase, dhh family protein [Lactobacillus selangorensis]